MIHFVLEPARELNSPLVLLLKIINDRISVTLTRNADDSFSFATNAWEAGGDVFYQEILGSYDPVNPTSGDTEVSNIAINSFDGIVFGIFDDESFVTTGSYTVSNIAISAVLDAEDLQSSGQPCIELDENGDIVLAFEPSRTFLPGTLLSVERSTTLLENSFDEIFQFDFINEGSTFLDTGIQEVLAADQLTLTDTNDAEKGFYRIVTTLPN